MAPRNMQGRKVEGVKPLHQPDAQEEAALNRAAAALSKLGPADHRTIAAVAISEWILARTSMSASHRINADLLFDLNDARLRGFIEAALPAIGANVAHLPADVPFFDLDKDQVTDLFVAGIAGAQEAAVAAAESLGFPFDDHIPFGEAA